MSDIAEIVKSRIQENLLTTSDVVDILNVSRERIRQMINDKILPAKYIFNQNSNRKQYIFDKVVLEEYVKDGFVKWFEPEDTHLLSISEINNILQCPKRWVYDMTRNGSLIPEVVAGQNGQLMCLYNLIEVQKAWSERGVRGSNKGYRKSTLKLLHKIKMLHEQGFNDSEIARELNKKQPLISKLRKEAGLVSLCRRGRPRTASAKVEHLNPVLKDVPF